MKDYYKILELEASAKLGDVKKSYKRLALKWHPDRNNDPGAEEMFKTIAEAYEVLSDDEKREIYDKNNDVEFNFKSPSTVFKELFPKLDLTLLKNLSALVKKLLSFNNMDFKDQIYEILKKIKNISKTDSLFSDLMKDYHQFIGQRRKYMSEKTPDLIYSFNISLEDYYNLTVKETSIQIVKSCYLCSKNYNKSCKICKGTIFYISTRIFKLPLNEYELILKKEGNHLPEYKNPGDLIIYLDDKKHNIFERIGGYDLYHIHKIEVLSVKNINKIIIKHLDSKFYQINLKKDKLNNLVKIKDMGLPDHCGNLGDLYIEINIPWPTADLSVEVSKGRAEESKVSLGSQGIVFNNKETYISQRIVDTDIKIIDDFETLDIKTLISENLKKT